MKLPSLSWPIRWESSALIFVGLICNYAMRLNISIAIIKMSESTSTPMWPLENYSPISWDAEDRALVLGAFFYGYVVFQVPGGRMAEMYGTKKVLGYSMLMTSLLGLLTPLAAYTSIWAIFALRVAQGLFEGVTYPSLNPHISRWAPLQERTRYTSFTYLGGTTGTVITLPLCGLLLDKYPWEVVFYSISIFSLAWCFLWFALATDLPEQHPRVSPKERQLILENRTFDPAVSEKQLQGKVLPLIRDMLCNRAVWVIIVWAFCQSWGYAMVVSFTPTFMDKVLHFDIKDNGLLSMVPHLCRALIAPLVGLVYDFLSKKGVPHLTLQKSFTAIYGIGMIAGLIAIPQLATWELRFYCVAAMSFAFGCSACAYSGDIINTLSIAPNYSGTIFGLRNSAGHISGFLMPLVISAFTSCEGCEGDAEQWGYAFWIFAGLYVIGLLNFLCFATTEEQPFNKSDYSRGDEAVVIPTFQPSYRKRGLSTSEYL